MTTKPKNTDNKPQENIRVLLPGRYIIKESKLENGQLTTRVVGLVNESELKKKPKGVLDSENG